MGMKALFDLMHTGENNSTVKGLDSLIFPFERPVALFGDVCTNVNEPVAMASKYWDIVQLSYSETHSKFSTAESRDVSVFIN